MNIIRNTGIRIINIFPSPIKWKIINIPFFNKRIRINFSITRSHLLSQNSKIIVIGANDGVSFDNLFEDLDPLLTSGILIEPSGKYFKDLFNNTIRFPLLKAHRYALSSSNTNLLLYQLNEIGLKKMPDWGRGLGSFSKAHLLKHDNISDLDIEFESVTGRTFTSIIQEFDLFSVNYLQIDTEGYDGEIIKMIDFSVFEAQLIKFEIANLNEQELSEVRKILKKQAFFLVRIGGDMIAYSKFINPHFY